MVADPVEAMRLQVLEMTVAALVARLPQADFEEVIAMLVFVAKGAEAAMDNLPDDASSLEEASHYAVAMLTRIEKSRRGDRTVGRH